MNGFDFHLMHEELFEVFGIDGSVARGVASPVPVRVVIDEGVARIGDYGQVVGHFRKASFLSAQWVPQQGDVLTVGATSKRVETLLLDDGHVAEAVLHG